MKLQKYWGGKGQFIVLKTTNSIKPLIEGDYKEPIYTGEIIKTRRKYKCKNCNKEYWVGLEEKYTTIEQLKSKGCEQCHKMVFDLLERKQENAKN